MFKVIKQVAIIASFLLLTVFSFVYYQDGDQERSREEETVFVNMVINLVQSGGGALSSVANLISPQGSKEKALSQIDYLEKIDSTGKIINEISSFPSQRPKLFKTNRAHSEKSEFKDFVNSFIGNIPVIYLDSKIYSNAFRGFWSALKFTSNNTN